MTPIEILNKVVLICEVIATTLLVVVSIKVNKKEHWLFTTTYIAYSINEIASFIAYRYCKNCLSALYIIGNLLMVLEVLILLTVFYGLVENPRTKKIILAFNLSVFLCFLITHFTVQPIYLKAPAYTYVPAYLLVVISVLMYLKEKLSIIYSPNKHDNFWIFICTSIIFSTLSQLPNFTLFNYITDLYTQIPDSQLNNISGVTYSASIITYSLIIRSCYVYR